MTPLRTGLALTFTVGLFYGLCALVWALASGPFPGFMNSLFHGLDFSTMVQPRPFAWQGFLMALIVLSTWAFFAGVFCAGPKRWLKPFSPQANASMSCWTLSKS